MKWLSNLFAAKPTYAVERLSNNVFIVVWAETGKPVPGEPAFVSREDAEAHIRTLEARLGE